MTGALGVVAAYLLGSIPTGYIVARIFGVGDIRAHGSGNIGTTNVLRTAGKLPAVLTLLGDVLKGYVAVWIGHVLGDGEPTFAAINAVAVVAGNCWSVFLGFRGGKGGATGLGAALRLTPWATGPAVLVWVITAALFRYASLATLTATLCVPLGTLLFRQGAAVFAGTALAVAIVLLRHRENITRLMAGTERRLGERSGAA